MKPKAKPISYNPQFDKPLHGGKHVRWIENASKGLRRVGYVDEIISLNHTGWYTDEFGDSKMRGIVYQLPARNGKPVFAYGYDDPNNLDCALLCFDNDAATKEDAARMADRFAEKNAEEEREYQEAWQAGSQYSDLNDQVKEARANALQLIVVIKEERHATRHSADPMPLLQAAYERMQQRIREVCDLKAKRAKLWEEYEHLREPRNHWRKHLWSAFAEGAGINS